MASRVIKAPLSRVFDALADPDVLAGWLPAAGRLIETEPDERVVLAVEFCSGDPAFAAPTTMIWTMTRVDGGTRVDLRVDDLSPAVPVADHQQLLASTLDDLAAHLARTQPVFRAE